MTEEGCRATLQYISIEMAKHISCLILWEKEEKKEKEEEKYL